MSLLPFGEVGRGRIWLYLCRPMAIAKSIAFHTLGCKLNYSETSTISRMMESEGFVKKEFDELADVYVRLLIMQIKNAVSLYAAYNAKHRKV